MAADGGVQRGRGQQGLRAAEGVRLVERGCVSNLARVGFTKTNSDLSAQSKTLEHSDSGLSSGNAATG